MPLYSLKCPTIHFQTVPLGESALAKKPDLPLDLTDAAFTAAAQTEAAEPVKPKRKADPELVAMRRINDVLDGLTTKTRGRVAAWIYARFVDSGEPKAE